MCTNYILVNKQLEEIARAAYNILSSSIDFYPESKKGYEIFGVDILVRSDYSIVLLEINDKVGYHSQGPISDEYKKLSDLYFNWVFDCLKASNLV